MNPGELATLKLLIRGFRVSSSLTPTANRVARLPVPPTPAPPCHLPRRRLSVRGSILAHRDPATQLMQNLVGAKPGRLPVGFCVPWLAVDVNIAVHKKSAIFRAERWSIWLTEDLEIALQRGPQ